MQLKFLKVDIADYVALVTMDRPPVHAQNAGMREEIVQVFDRLGDDDAVRSIVLTGSGSVFSAGADIKERPGVAEEPGRYTRHNRLTRATFYSISECARPVVGAINGPALGAGFALAASCDILLASANAVFGMPEVDVGLAGGVKFLQSLLGKSKSRLMLFTGERISAAEMYRLGAIEACLPQEDLLPAAMAVARRIAGKSPLTVRLLKESVGMVENLTLRDGYRLEQNVTVRLSKTEDAKEAQGAFNEKRPPVFVGR